MYMNLIYFIFEVCIIVLFLLLKYVYCYGYKKIYKVLYVYFMFYICKII